MTDKKYEKVCKAYAEKYTEAPMVTVTIVMSPNQARDVISLGGFSLYDFFQGRDAVCIRSNPKMKADLEDAAAFGLHCMLDCLFGEHIEAGEAANDNEEPNGKSSKGEQG